MFYLLDTKRIFAFFNLFTLLFLLAGCSYTDDSASGKSNSTETSGTVVTTDPVKETIAQESAVASDTSGSGESVESVEVPPVAAAPKPDTEVVDVTEEPTVVAEVTTNTAASPGNSVPERASGTNPFKQVFSDIRRTEVNKVLTFPIQGSSINTASRIRVTQQPAKGTLTVGGDQLTFTPNSGFSGRSIAKLKVDWLDGTSDTATITFYTEQVGSRTYFDQRNGNNANPGTQAQPKKSGIEAAIESAGNGDRIYVKSGQTYDLRMDIRNTRGTATAPIVLSSYGGGKAKFSYSGNDETIFLGSNIGRLVFENIVITNPKKTSILAYNQAANLMDVVFDNVDVVNSPHNGFNWQASDTDGKVTIIHSNISDNNGSGFSGGKGGSAIMLNNNWLRNADTKDYTGGAIEWNTYLTELDFVHFEGNLSEDSEGLMKLRANHNVTVQKNVFRRAWVIGIGAGGEIAHGHVRAFRNGVIANNLVEASQGAMSFGDQDNRSNGGGIHNVDVYGNVVVRCRDYTGWTKKSCFFAHKRESNTNFRVFDNIFWGNESVGQTGARFKDAPEVDFYNNIIGGGGGDQFTNYVTRVDNAAPLNIHDNQLYKFQSGTVIHTARGNTEISAVPQKVQNILDNL